MAHQNSRRPSDAWFRGPDVRVDPYDPTRVKNVERLASLDDSGFGRPATPTDALAGFRERERRREALLAAQGNGDEQVTTSSPPRRERRGLEALAALREGGE